MTSLIVDITSVYNEKKNVAGILRLCKTLQLSQDISEIIPVVTDMKKDSLDKIKSEFNSLNITPLEVNGSLAQYLNNFPSNSNIISEDPLVVSAMNEQTYWDIEDLTKYSKSELSSMIGFSTGAMGIYSILRGNAFLGINPIQGIIQEDAITACNSSNTVNELMKKISNKDDGIPDSVLEAKSEIFNSIRLISGHFKNKTNDVSYRAADISSVSSEQSTNSDSIVYIKSPEDLTSVHMSLKGSEKLYIDYSDNEMMIVSGNDKFHIELENGISKDILFKTLREPFSTGEVVLFDTKSIRKEFNKHKILNENITDIGTLVYISNNLHKHPELLGSFDEFNIKGYPVDASMESRFNRLAKTEELLTSINETLNEKQKRYYETIENPILEIASEMETVGVKLNTSRLQAIDNKLKSTVKQCDQHLASITNQPVSVKDRPSIARLLYDELGLRLKGNSRSTSAEALDDLIKNNPNHKPVIDTIKLGFQQQTMIEKYTSVYPDFINEDTGLIHPTILTKSTKTGRFSCIDPNLLGIPKKTKEGQQIKSSFEPSISSMAFIKGDYSQMEMKILAHLTKEPVLINAFRDNLDIHRATAAQVYNKPYNEVTDTERTNAKAVNFGIIYGMQKYSLAKKTNTTPQKAEEFTNLYFSKLPNVQKYLAWVKDRAMKTGSVKTILGREIKIENAQSNDPKLVNTAMRQAINAPMQGSAADIVKLAMANLFEIRAQEGLGFKFVLQIHDEIVLCSPMDEIDITKEILKETMERVVELAVPINVDIEAGYNLNSKSLDKAEPENGLCIA
ncbi:DNA polymerase [Pseudoalteromonas sp. OFAV1]|uniref:DNA polymerase A family protein n=1 Tax=Pseudoalteromonas sp. OFAV1 TaxID=2908892 RepID=UPI001F3715DE|nr:DNA polymerase A family protein [Pseudoalteromonas sp. OFAV1]MCF2900962.1 DNA polymerase [Pseudoalteromonas sp. OFAV1]